MRYGLILALALISVWGDTVAQSNKELSILTWNVFLRPRHLFWGDHQIRRANDIVGALASSGHDVIVLQEAFDKGSIRKLKQKLDSIYPYQILPSKTKKWKLSNGIWILSKHPITLRDSVFYSAFAHADRFSDKGAVLARIDKNGTVFDLVGTHTQAMPGERFRLIRDQQYAQIRDQLLDKHITSEVPQMVVGDLNTDRNDTTAYGSMLKALDASDGFVSVPKEVKICTKEAQTWGCSMNELIPDRYKGKTELLDYILLRNIPKNWEAERTLVVYRNEKNGRSVNLSDHYGIEIKIQQ